MTDIVKGFIGIGVAGTIIGTLLSLGVLTTGFAKTETVTDLTTRVTVLESEMGHLVTKDDLAPLKIQVALNGQILKRIEAFHTENTLEGMERILKDNK